MASRKEYEALFRLNAQLGGGFNSTFKSAQSELSAFRKEMQALNRTQSDIAAYQKQQAAVENTKKKLETLQQQYDNIQREIKETEGFSSDLENKLLSKQQQIDKTSHSLEQQTDKLHQMDSALKEAGVNTGDLKAESAKLGTQMEELRKEQSKAAESAEDFGKSSANAFSEIQQAIAAAGIAVALKEIYEGYMACVASAGDFEESMSTVEALSGANAEELAALSAEAKDLGATTKFTAKESADAMTYMAMAGWDANDMLSGMDGMLQLAAASGEDLAQVSDIVTDNLSAFGLTASDTAHFSDVLAAAATSANTNVSIMGETFKMSASVAGALGYSVEDVAVAVGLMANSGVKGSIAGTALKNTFNGLLEGVTLTGAAFGEYEYSAVKADGTMKSFGSTIEELRGYFDQMTEAERVNNAMTIAGERGYNGLLAILNATDEDYASLTASINNCSGAAAKMAAIKMDNMNGQLTLAKSAWDALKMSVGDQFTPVMRKAYEVEAKVFNGLSKFIEKHPTLIKAIAAVVAVVGTAIAALTAYAAIKKVVNALNLIPLVSGAGPIVAVVAAVAGLTAGIVALASATNTEEEELAALSATSRKQYAQMQDLQDQYEEICATMGETSSEAQLLKAKLDQETEAFRANSETQEEYLEQRDKVLSAYEEQASVYDATITGIEQEWAGTQNLISRLTQLTEAEYQSAAAKQEILAIVDILNERIPELGLNYDMLTGKLNMTPEEVMSAARADVDKDRKEADYQAFKDAMQNESGLQQQYQKDYENQMAAYELLQRKKKELADLNAWEKYYGSDGSSGYRTPTGGVISDYEHGELIGKAQGEINKAEAEWKAAKAVADESKAAWDDNIATQHELAESLATVSEETDAAAQPISELQGCTNELKASMSQLAAAYDEAYHAALESVSGQYALWDEADDIVAMSASSINAALESQIEHWQTYNANLANLGDRAADIEGLNEMLATFADGSADSVNAVAGMAEASDEDLRQMVANWQMLQQEQQTTATNLAEVKTGITEETDEMLRKYTDTIKDMDLSDEAKESASSTILAFIEAADEMLPQVQAAYARLGNAALYALGQGTYVQPEGRQSRAGNTMYEANATGTTYAADAFIAGEEGPELILGRRGASVFPAQETQRIIDAIPNRGNGGSTQITFAPVYHLEGVSNAADLEAVLRDHDAEMREYIQQVVADAETDAARRRY